MVQDGPLEWITKVDIEDQPIEGSERIAPTSPDSLLT